MKVENIQIAGKLSDTLNILDRQISEVENSTRVEIVGRDQFGRTVVHCREHESMKDILGINKGLFLKALNDEKEKIHEAIKALD